MAGCRPAGLRAERALARWESVSGVDFVRVEDRADRVADIRIGFGQLDGSYLHAAQPVVRPHAHSAFPLTNLSDPGCR